MKVLFFFNPKGYMDGDFVYTLRKRGIEVHEEKINFAMSPEGHAVEMFSSQRLMNILDTFCPDMVMSFNGNGVDDRGILAHEYERRGIPFVTWFLDRPRAADIGNKFSRSGSFMFVFDSVYIQVLKDAGFNHVFFLPLATNPDRFMPLLRNDQESAVCFIGALDYPTIQYLARNIDAMLKNADDGFYQCIEASIQKQSDQIGRDTWHIIEETLRENGYGTDGFSQVFRDMLEGFVEREASMRLRMDAVRAVGERFPVVVFGDELWGDVVGESYKGRIAYQRSDIVDVYNRYAVHVNISKYQLRWAINQRPYDVSACGGFLITDIRHDLYELFTQDEIVSFNTVEGLVDLVGSFMHDTTQRRRFADKAQEKVLSAHTYEHRIDTVLNKVFG